MNEKVANWWEECAYYFIIVVVSIVCLVFLPMLGSTIGLEWNIPNNTVGWIVWIVTKCLVAMLNVVIFHSFMQQGKVNIRNDPNFKEANEILGKIKIKEYRPRSPAKFLGGQYGWKGTTIFICTGISTIALTQALLQFDYVTMLTYLFTIIMGVVFGIMQMFKAQDYWTHEYLDYAKQKQEEDKHDIIE